VGDYQQLKSCKKFPYDPKICDKTFALAIKHLFASRKNLQGELVI
jgi:hypothetical protein